MHNNLVLTSARIKDRKIESQIDINFLFLKDEEKRRIKIITPIYEFKFLTIHRVFKNTFSWFVLCTLEKEWSCLCCEEEIDKQNKVLVQVFDYKTREIKFLFLNYYHIEELKKLIVRKKIFSSFPNDFFIMRTGNNIGLYYQKECNLTERDKEKIKTYNWLNIAQVTRKMNLSVSQIKELFLQDFLNSANKN